MREIVGLVDPVGESVRGRVLPNGVRIDQVRVPFGVVGVIYEARPNVTVDIAALALKSGNAVVLRGGSAAENTNAVLVSLIQDALSSVGLPADSVQTIDEFGRDGARDLMQARGLVDVLIPRGSANLINTVVAESKVPVIETGAGVVHVFLDESANQAVGGRHRAQREGAAPERVQCPRNSAGSSRRGSSGCCRRSAVEAARRRSGHPRRRRDARAFRRRRYLRPKKTGRPSI